MTDEEMQWRAAIHEASHAAAALTLCGNVQGLRVRQRGEGSCWVSFPGVKPETAVLFRMIVAYAGGVGERLFYRAAPDDPQDLLLAIERSREYAADPKQQRRIRALARQRAKEILTPMRGQIVAVARMLKDAAEIDTQKLMESSLPSAALAVQKSILARKK